MAWPWLLWTKIHTAVTSLKVELGSSSWANLMGRSRCLFTLGWLVFLVPQTRTIGCWQEFAAHARACTHDQVLMTSLWTTNCNQAFYLLPWASIWEDMFFPVWVVFLTQRSRILATDSWSSAQLKIMITSLNKLWTIKCTKPSFYHFGLTEWEGLPFSPGPWLALLA